MKISCSKNNFLDVLQLVERFTGKQLTLPVLSNILMEAADKKIILLATNLETGIRVVIPCKVLASGSVTIPGKVACSLVQSIDDGELEIEEKSGSVNIKTNSANFTLQGIPAKDFPILPKVKAEHSLSVNPRSLGRGLSQVLPAVSLSDFKPELAGVFFKCEGRQLTLAATDSFRLAEKKISLDNGSLDMSFILPARTAQELSRMISEAEEPIAICEGENQVSIELSNTQVVSRLVDGVFPEYGAIIPKEFETYIACSREELIRKIRGASILASKLQDVALHISPSGCFIETKNADLGQSKVRFAAKSKGKNAEVVFNYRYLLDGLEALDGEEVVLSLNSESTPALIQDLADPLFRYVVMPIRNI